MEKMLVLSARHPRLVVVILVVITLLAASQLPKLQIYVSPQSLSVQDDPEQAAYERSVATFGSDKISVIYLQDDALFRRDKLQALKAEIARINALPFVLRTRSLFSVPYVRVEGELVRTDPFLDPLPETEQAAAALKEAALKSPFVRKNLLSQDGRTMAVNVYIDDTGREVDFDARVTRALEESVRRLSQKFDRVFQVGLPYVRTAISEQIFKDTRLITGAAVMVLLFSLLMTLRRVSAALVPLLTSGLSVIWTLGGLAAVGLPLNVMTALVPVLLIVVGSTEDVHLVTEYYKGVGAGYGRLRAVRYMARRIGLAVGLTFLTTALGFLSISANPIHLVREFSLVATLGLSAHFLISLTLIPVYLEFLGERGKPVRWSSSPSTQSRLWVTRIGELILRHRLPVFATGACLFAVCLCGALSMRVNNSLLDYFADDTPIKQRVLQMHRDLSGVETFSVVLDARVKGTFERVNYLKELQKIQGYLSRDPAFDYSVSFADFVALLNSTVNDTGVPELPSEDRVVETLLFFTKHEDVKEYISADYSKTSILVRHNIGGSSDLANALKGLKAFIGANIDPGLDVSITGESILTGNAADYLSSAQIRSLGLMLTAIFAVVALLFANPLAGLLTVVVNVVPLMGLFGAMGYLGIPLDSATTLIGAIALGVSVDHTLHFMVRYNQRLKSERDESAAVVATLRDEAAPMTAASLALAAGIGSLAFSSFIPIANFGLLTALVMLLAYLANFVFTPILLSFVRLITLWDLLSTPLRRELINNCSLFRGMRPGQVRRVVLLGVVRDYAPGERIMHHGEVGEELYVVLDGSVKISTERGDGSWDFLEVCTVGDLFGVTSLMCGRQRMGTAIASEPARVLGLNWGRLQRIGYLNPHSGCRLYRNLSAVVAGRFADLVAEVPANGAPPRRIARAGRQSDTTAFTARQESTLSEATHRRVWTGRP